MPIKQTALKRNKSRRSRRNRRQSGGEGTSLPICQQQSGSSFRWALMSPHPTRRGQWQVRDSIPSIFKPGGKHFKTFEDFKENIYAIIAQRDTADPDKISERAREIEEQVDALCKALKANGNGNTELVKQLEDELLKFKECGGHTASTNDVSYPGEDTSFKIGGGKSRRQSRSKKNQKKSRQSRRQSQSKKNQKKTSCCRR